MSETELQMLVEIEGGIGEADLFNLVAKSDLASEEKAALMAVQSYYDYKKDFEERDNNSINDGLALWRIIRYLTKIEMPMRIIDFTGMLYPNNNEYFAQQLTSSAYKIIQKQAAAMLANNAYENEEHKEWLTKIIDSDQIYGYSVIKPNKEEIANDGE